MTIRYDNGEVEHVAAEWKDYTQTGGGDARAVKSALVVAARAVAGPGVPVTICYDNGEEELVPAEWKDYTQTGGGSRRSRRAEKIALVDAARLISGPGVPVTIRYLSGEVELVPAGW